MRFTTAIVSLSVLSVGLSFRASAEPPKWLPAAKVAAPAFEPVRARALYNHRCRPCHGPEGKGDGPTARFLFPPPRDFTTGVFKLRSTRVGDVPTDLDLFATISRGLSGTAMPSWSGLSTADRWQLVHMVKSFSDWFEEPAAEVIEIGAPPPASDAVLLEGRAVYDRLKCAECHGEDGRGRGTSSKKLVDYKGRTLYPGNLLRGETFRGGCAPSDRYRTFMVGMMGTPMPSFADQMTAAQGWSLVAYLRSRFVTRPRCRPRLPPRADSGARPNP